MSKSIGNDKCELIIWPRVYIEVPVVGKNVSVNKCVEQSKLNEWLLYSFPTIFTMYACIDQRHMDTMPSKSTPFIKITSSIECGMLKSLLGPLFELNFDCIMRVRFVIPRFTIFTIRLIHCAHIIAHTTLSTKLQYYKPDNH